MSSRPFRLVPSASRQRGLPAIGVELRGAPRPTLPYVQVFAMAPPDGVDGGLLITVRSASPDWPAADALLASLRILTRAGVAPANDGPTGPALPVISKDPRSE